MPADVGTASGSIVVLTRDTPSGRAVANAISAEAFDAATHDVIVVVEPHLSVRTMVRGRIHRLGIFTVVGQLLFLTLVVPILRLRGRRRIQGIIDEHGLRTGRFEMPVRRVASMNDPEVGALLERERPSVVVVNGTRILTASTLDATDAPILNMHAGITPAYRGVHGGYWALVDKAPAFVGTTIHLVDRGIDTGSIISQVTFSVSSADTFVTYPFLHLAFGLPLLVRAVDAALRGTLRPMIDPPDLPTRLRTHPTIWSYLWTRLRRGVR